jgi:hypothetical protein
MLDRDVRFGIRVFRNCNALVTCSTNRHNLSLIRLVGGGVQLGPLGTSATNWPTVPAPGDYEDGEFGGMMIGTGNRSTRRKLAPVPLCPPQKSTPFTDGQ